MAYATLLSLTQTLEQILHPDDQFMVLHETEQQIMRSLQEKVSFLLSFLENDSLKYAASNLEPRIRDVAYQVEVIIESGFPRQNHKGSQKIVEEIDSILEQVVKLKEMNKVEDLLPPAKSLFGASSKLGSSDKTKIVGQHEEMLEIKDRLIRLPSGREIISIVGMPGIGKTTLTKTLYDDLVIVKHFDVRAWVTVSHDYHERPMLTSILDSIQNIDHDSYPEDLASHIHKTLKQRRYLIVMDDMWDTNAWDQVKRYFPDDNNGSRVVLTTRLQDVAVHVQCPDSIYRLSLLSPDDSWKLLRQSAFMEEHCPPEFEDLGKEIANNCKGLPLSLALIGGILYKAERKLDVWRYVGENVNSTLNNIDHQVMDILSLSYKHLSHHLRACFLYMGVFPEDHEISKSKLIKLWIAEGFIKPSPSKFLEEVACECLENLIDRNMIIVRKYNYVGGIKKCGIHDLMRDLCMRIGGDEKFLKVVCSQPVIPPDYGYDFRHLYIHSVSPDCLAGIYGLPANSLISSRTESPNTDLSPCVLSSHRLRILDAQKNPFSEFQDEIVELVGLRYISCNDLNGDYFPPSSIPKLSNLQTLATTSWKAVILPFEIWLMPRLQHIMTRKCFLPYPKSWEKVVPLKNLQTLKGVTNFRFTKDAIQMMPNLKKLGIIFELDRSAELSSNCIGNLAFLHQLESLNVSIKVKSDTEYPRPENLFLPPTLKKLTLSGFNLSQEHMAIIGSLQDLEELNLKRISFDNSQWEATEGEFLCLKSLFVIDTDFEYLKADETSFPILESLRFSICTKLIEIPPEIGDIPTLQLIRLEYCSKSAEDSVLLIRKEQQNLGNYNLQIDLHANNACILKVNVHCDRCKLKVLKKLAEIYGVDTINIDAEQGRVIVSGNFDPATPINKLATSGIQAELWSAVQGRRGGLGGPSSSLVQ